MLRSVLCVITVLACVCTLAVSVPPVEGHVLMKSFNVYVDSESFFVGEAIGIHARVNTTNPYQKVEVTDVSVYDSENGSIMELHGLSVVLSDTSASADAGVVTMVEEDNYTVSVRAKGFYDVDGDDKLDMKDVGTVILAFGSFPEHPRGNLGDIDQNGIVDMKDIGHVCRRWELSAACTFTCHLLEPNVVPEVPFGTIVTIIALLGATGFYAYKKRVSDSMHAPKSSSV